MSWFTAPCYYDKKNYWNVLYRYLNLKLTIKQFRFLAFPHSVEPVWGRPNSIWRDGGPREFCTHTHCWSAVHCGWGETFVCLGITYACFVPRRLPVITRGPKCQNKKSLLSVTSFECHHQDLRKIIMQVQNLNGDCRTNIDRVRNVFHWGFSLVSQHNL